ncbi:hypothetical protein D0C36_05780 [Mucilaginibacter conchicola]|uniref:TonB C-terminal domain-containing protein n=1 Tax=Mucilaginibacter conchicola TaxID=2303333 RepID=A0A372NY45_9SPHI|nr:M56 family metallopeptidase [Mucilaginibacter conchicola]RFZ95036.1 hypothetical protein D0C36_05780 [Mucilaginibacter conchicola]
MSWLHYLIEANIYLLVFYLCYRLLLANNTHYTLGRVYLILSCIMAFFIPFTQVTILKPATDTVTQVVTQTSYVLPANIRVSQPTDTSFRLSADELIPYLYIGGAMIAAVILIVRLVRLFSITRSGTSLKHGNYQRIDLPHSQTAFSFFNYLYIGTELKQPDTIIAHELVHIRQKHTLDILFLELLKIINWFSPVVYLVQQSLKTVHEYIADEQTAAHESDAIAYSSFLLNNAYGLQGASVTHSFFNNNLLKRRIIMLNQQRSGKLARLKYLAAVPLCAGMLCTSTLLFSKDYGLIDFAPQKQTTPTVQIDSGKYTLKLTDLKSGITAIADDMELRDSTADKATYYSVKTFPDEPKEITISNGDHFRIEKVLRDSARSAYEQTQKLPPPPPPPARPVSIYNKDKNGSALVIAPQLPTKALAPPPPYEKAYVALYKHMAKTLRYPQSARESKTDGNVILSYRLNADHKITDIKVEKGIGNGCDEAAVNALSSFKGTVNKAPGQYYMATVFALQGYTKKYQSIDNYRSKPNFAGVVVATGYMNAPPPPPVEPGKNGKNMPLPPPPAPKMNKNVPPPPPPVEPDKTPGKLMSNEQNLAVRDLYTHLRKTLRYPKAARDKDVAGRVIVTFDVNDEKISNVKVVRGVTSLVDDEVVKALNNFDKPLNLPVHNYSIPVLFHLDNGKEQIESRANFPLTQNYMPQNGKSAALNEIVVVGYKN